MTTRNPLEIAPTQVTRPGESSSTRAAQAVRALQDQNNRSPGTFDQQEAMRALAILRTADIAEYQRWLPRVADLIGAATGEEVPPEQVALAVDVLAGIPTPGTADQPAPDSVIDVGAPQPPEQTDTSQPPLLGGIPEGSVPALRPGGTSPAHQVSGGFQAPYRYGDQFDFQSMSTLEIQRLQKELEQAGLLEKGSYRPGFWDGVSAEAMRAAMEYGNRSGTNWESVVKQLKALPKPPSESEFAQFRPDPGLMPDIASLRQTVKRQYRQALGREPTADELREFVNSLHADFAAADAQRLKMEKEAFFEENFPDTPNPERARFEEGTGQERETPSVEPETITQIDPAARFVELFEERMGPEIRRRERVANVSDQSTSVMSSLLTMQRLVG